MHMHVLTWLFARKEVEAKPTVSENRWAHGLLWPKSSKTDPLVEAANLGSSSLHREDITDPTRNGAPNL